MITQVYLFYLKKKKGSTQMFTIPALELGMCVSHSFSTRPPAAATEIEPT